MVMDFFESFCSVDDFLDFSSDIEEDQNPRANERPRESFQEHPPKHPFSSSKTSAQLSLLERSGGDLFPVLGEEEEEELEWLNEEEFPPLEPCVVAAPAGSPKRHSPVSVLEGRVTGGSGFRVPGRARSRIQRRRRVGAPGVLGVWGAGDERSVSGSTEAEPRRRCRHCMAEKTPQWRAGPLGPKTLCNACGVRYKAGRLVPEYRPASSPTFSSELHSNSHRKIIEMRRKKLENG